MTGRSTRTPWCSDLLLARVMDRVSPGTGPASRLRVASRRRGSEPAKPRVPGLSFSAMMMTLGPGFTLIVAAPLALLTTRGRAGDSTSRSVARRTAILERPEKTTERKPAFPRGATYLTRMLITPAAEDVVPVSVVPARTGTGGAAVAAPLPAAPVSKIAADSPAADSPASHRRATGRRPRLPGEASSPGADELRSLFPGSDTSTSLVSYLAAASGCPCPALCVGGIVPDSSLSDGPQTLARIACDLDVNRLQAPHRPSGIARPLLVNQQIRRALSIADRVCVTSRGAVTFAGSCGEVRKRVDVIEDACLAGPRTITDRQQ